MFLRAAPVCRCCSSPCPSKLLPNWVILTIRFTLCFQMILGACSKCIGKVSITWVRARGNRFHGNGTGGYQAVVSPPAAYLELLMVAGPYRQTGVGSAVIEAVRGISARVGV